LRIFTISLPITPDPRTEFTKLKQVPGKLELEKID